MIQGNDSSKLQEGFQKAQEKSVPSKILQKKSKLPEKTKFTLKYDSSSKIPRITEKYITTQTCKSEVVDHGSKKVTSHILKSEERSKSSMIRPPQLKLRDLQKTKIASSSVHYISNPKTMAKTYSMTQNTVTTTRKTAIGSITKKKPCDSKGAFLSSKPDTLESRAAKPQMKNKTETKMQDGISPTLKKSMTYHATVHLTMNSNVCSRSQRSQKSLEDTKVLGGEKTVMQEKKRSCVIDGPKSMELKRHKSEASSKSNRVTVTAHRYCSEDNTRSCLKYKTECLTSQLEKKFSAVSQDINTEKLSTEVKESVSSSKIMNEWEATSDRVLDVHNDIVEVNAQNSKEHVNESEKFTGNEEIDQSDVDSVDVSEVISANVEYQTKSDSSDLLKDSSLILQPADNYDCQLSTDRSENDEFLNLDKKVWVDLELDIKDSCDKSEFLLGDDSGANLSEFMDHFLVPENDVSINDFENPEINFTLSKEPSNSDEKSKLMDEEMPPLKDEQVIYPNNEFNQLTVTKETDLKEINVESKPEEKPVTCDEIKQEKAKSSDELKQENTKLKHENHKGPSKIVDHAAEPQPKTVKKEKTIVLSKKSLLETSQFLEKHTRTEYIDADMEELIIYDAKHVTLYQPHENQMLVYDVANCVAAQAYLQISGVKYDLETRKNAEHMSPSGRVPFITCGQCIVPEFEGIVSFMQYKKFCSTTISESDTDAFRSIISMIINKLEMAERYICWFDDETLNNYTKPQVSDSYPFPLNHIIYWKKRMDERKADNTNKCLDSAITDISNCLQKLSHRLGKKHFFFGNEANEIDALVFGHIYALCSVSAEGPFREIQLTIQKYPNLISFCTKFDRMFLLRKFSSVRLLNETCQSD